jgi:hypothetical protein
MSSTRPEESANIHWSATLQDADPTIRAVVKPASGTSAFAGAWALAGLSEEGLSRLEVDSRRPGSMRQTHVAV